MSTRPITIEYQLDQWLKGRSLHNPGRNECCPDFSCCEPGIKTPLELKERYVKAYREKDHQAQMSLLGMFLATGIEQMKKTNPKIAGKKIQVLGDGSQDGDQKENTHN